MMKPELHMTSTFSLEQNDECYCSTAVGFIQVLAVKRDVMLIGHWWSVLSLLCGCASNSGYHTQLHFFFDRLSHASLWAFRGWAVSRLKRPARPKPAQFPSCLAAPPQEIRKSF